MTVFVWIQPFFLWYFGFVNILSTILIFLGSIKVYFRRKELQEDSFLSVLQSNTLPDITFLIPMYNESMTILENIESILHLSYQHKKIVIVNDGSTDSSVDRLIQALDMVSILQFYEDVLPSKKVKTLYQSRLHPEIRLLDKEHGGKFDSVNAGVNACDTTLFLVVDADTVIDPAGFAALIRPVLLDPKTIAVGSSIYIKNGCTLDYNHISTKRFPKNYFTSMQGMEYIRSFLSRMGWNYFNGNFIIAGAFSLFSRDLIVRVGGFCNSVGEDVEMTVRLHRIMKETKKEYKIFYVPDPIAWTVAPETYQALRKQRSNWHLAVLETLFYHKHMCFNPRYGFFGFFIYPFWLLAEALEPVFEVIGYAYIIFAWWFGALQVPFLVFYLVLSFGLVFLYTFYSLLVEDVGFHKYPTVRSFFLLFSSCLVENIGYHQLNICWRIKGFYLFIKRFSAIKKEAKAIKAKIAKATSP